MTEIRLSALIKRFGEEFTALHATDLVIRSGEFITLLGPSGCGKTTTLRMIAGLEDPTDGAIMFGHTRVDRLPPGKRNVALVFQNYALYPHLNVRGNLEYPLKKRGVPADERARKIEAITKILHIEELLDRKPRQLSGGQQQRVALGRAMIRDPAVFLFDEPLSNLDAQLRAIMRAELIRLHKDIGKTMVYVTHDQLEAMTMSDRIVVMYKGEIQQVGTPKEVYNRPVNLFVAGFVGTPSMNFISGAMVTSAQDKLFRSEDGHIVLDTPAIAGLEAGRRIVIGVRPEHVELGTGPTSAHVRVVEDLGHESQVALRAGTNEIVVRAAAGPDLAMDQQVAITFKPDHLHIFDAETGMRIEPGRQDN